MPATPSSMTLAGFSLHLLPSGVFHQNIVNIIGTGVALDLKKLFHELDDLTAQGCTYAENYGVRPSSGTDALSHPV